MKTHTIKSESYTFYSASHSATHYSCIHTNGWYIAGSKDGGVPAGAEKVEQVSHDNDNDDGEVMGVIELDVELEDDLCKLWDASINEVIKSPQ